MFDLNGRLALITGGNRGIGRHIALGMANMGANIAIIGRDEKSNSYVYDEVIKLGRSCIAIVGDVSDRSEVPSYISSIEKSLGAVDILVNNAAVTAGGGVIDQPLEDWDRVIETDLTACFLLTKLIAKGMMSRNRGKIINISSLLSNFGSKIVPSYSVAKGGLTQLTKSAAIEFGGRNIQVNAIAPGWIETEMTEAVKGTDLEKEMLNRTPMARWGRPEDLIGAAVFLASSASDFITGETIVVDGGYSVY